MTARSVLVSLFFICFGLGMGITNDINDQWADEHGGTRWIMISITPYQTVGDLGIATTEEGFNQTANGMLTYNKPADVTQDFGWISTLGAAWTLVQTILYSSVGFFLYLEQIGLLSSFYASTLTVLLILNHIFTIIYLLTGKVIY